MPCGCHGATTRTGELWAAQLDSANPKLWPGSNSPHWGCFNLPDGYRALGARLYCRSFHAIPCAEGRRCRASFLHLHHSRKGKQAQLSLSAHRHFAKSINTQQNPLKCGFGANHWGRQEMCSRFLYSSRRSL